MNTKTDWLLFRAQDENDPINEWADTVKEWEDETGSMLARVLHMSDPFQLSLSLPDEAAAAAAWNGNHDLKGCVRIRHVLGLDIELPCFLPFDGVFISERTDDLRPLPIVWSSWLCEAPGVRIVIPASKRMRDEKIRELRVGLPGGNFIRMVLGSPEQKELKKKEIGLGRFDAEESKYPSWLFELISGKPNAVWNDVYVRANELRSTIKESDQDDLAHRILMTFPLWLKYRACKVLLAALPMAVRKSMHEVGGDACADQIFDAITKVAGRLGDRLVPLSVDARREARRRGDADDGFVFVEPNNPVDLAARLTRVKRLQMSRHAMEEIPAEFRQNHPSFNKRVCPVESPESELVGLSLQLAQGARVDKDGFIVEAGDESLAEMGYRAYLGWGAGLIPLFQHNDGTRNMMGSKNLRQALPPMKKEKREAPFIKSGGEAALMKFTERLTRIGICPDVADSHGEMAIGHDLLVAYMPWYGWNMEDAIVINSRVVEDKLFDVAVTKRVKKNIRPGWHIEGGTFKNNVDISKVLGDANSSDDSYFERQGVVSKGKTIETGDGIVRLVSPSGQHVTEIKYKDASPAKVIEINCDLPEQEGMSGTLEYVLEKHIPLRLGDKLMGRHGNKGVIGRIEDEDKMPRLPDDDRLPEGFRGRRIDIILNPHGVISRMNIGQLLETHLGWLAHAGKCKLSELMVPGCKAAEIGIPEVGVIDHEKVQQKLAETGLDEQGRIRLYIPGEGSFTESPVVVGFEHIVRLKHIPELKSQARRGGSTSGYDSKTGQAVHGRVRGGGQRAGEMEVWALAGHQARCNLAEMLGGKADAVWARNWLPGKDADDSETEEGFPRQMKDWLFAVGIDMTRDGDGKIRFSLCTDAATIRKRAGGERHEVKCGDGAAKVQTASFACGKKITKGKAKGKYEYEFPLKGLYVTGGEEEEGTGKLRVGDVLSKIGYRIDGAMSETIDENTYTAKLISLKSGRSAGCLTVVFDDYSADKDWLKFHIFPGVGKNRPKWPPSLEKICGYGRFSAKKDERERGDAKGKNLSARYLKECVIKGRGKDEELNGEQHTIEDFNVTWPEKPTEQLFAVPPFGEAVRPATHGLFDELIFGSLKDVFVRARNEKWGYIELPIPVKFPFQAFGSEKEISARLAKIGVSDFTERTLEVIPVLPLRYRLPLMNCEMDDKLVADGYRPLLAACKAYRRLEKVANPEDVDKHKASLELAKQDISQAVEGLFFLLVGALKGKFGIVRRNGLGRRIDRSSRLVITPNPTLEWNQAAIPPSVLWELMGDKVLAWMKANGKDGDGAVMDILTGRVDLAEGWSWLRSCKDAKVLHLVAENLRAYLEAPENKETLLLLNRQPSLHKDSFQAFHPVVLESEDCEVFQLSPLCCKGLGADFDGDEMVGHYPVSDAAQKEAAEMLPDKNLLSSASGSSLAHFDQDFVMGSYWMSDFPDIVERLKAKLPGDCCHLQDFVKAMERGGHCGDKVGAELLRHICVDHPNDAIGFVSEWLRLALEACTRKGVSFGFYDLLDLTRKSKSQIAQDITPGVIAEYFAKLVKGQNGSDDADKVKDPNELVQDAIVKELNALLDGGIKGDESGLHVAGMALSGARGKKQIRQLVGARGFLSPGTLGYDLPANGYKQFWFEMPLTEGMDWETAFYAAMNARSSMCDKKLGTGHAGALTRKLVFALWPFKILDDDCGSAESKRSVVTCRCNGGFCAKCYGKLPNGKWPSKGYPVGLIAAQSIGERGTQLSMQSFHTGTRAFDMRTVRKILSGIDEREEKDVNNKTKIVKVDYFTDIGQASAFVKRFKSQGAYSSIRDCHFELLWRVLFDNEKHSLDGVIEAHDIITRLSYSRQAVNLLLAAMDNGEVEIDESPIAEVLFNNFASTEKA